jgi:hypothetical protein
MPTTSSRRPAKAPQRSDRRVTLAPLPAVDVLALLCVADELDIAWAGHGPVSVAVQAVLGALLHLHLQHGARPEDQLVRIASSVHAPLAAALQAHGLAVLGGYRLRATGWRHMPTLTRAVLRVVPVGTRRHRRDRT